MSQPVVSAEEAEQSQTETVDKQESAKTEEKTESNEKTVDSASGSVATVATEEVVGLPAKEPSSSAQLSSEAKSSDTTQDDPRPGSSFRTRRFSASSRSDSRSDSPRSRRLNTLQRGSVGREQSSTSDEKNGGVMVSRGSAARNQDVEEIKGFLDTTMDGHAVVREHFGQSTRDAYLSMAVVRRLGLRPGDYLEGLARAPRENDRYWGVQEITKVNGDDVRQIVRHTRFEDRVAVYPDEKIKLETGPDPISTRIIDLVAPIGKGQRGLVVSPPKAGKTTILKEIATGVAENLPDAHVMAVLIGERPEEVTDIRRHIDRITSGKGEVASSNFDEHASEQTRVAEVALERAKRLVEQGKDVVILLDSITRLARAYNLAMPTSGRTLSGGFDPSALYPPKRFFGAARNFEEPGSLTIIGTALIDTGSRMDDLVYEEFKGTGNMELHLDRKLAERRIYPAINIQRSSTRRDDLLFDNQEYQAVLTLQRMLDMLGEEERTAVVVQRMKATKTNKEFLASLKEG
jgi:transcription termination factor Rho